MKAKHIKLTVEDTPAPPDNAKSWGYHRGWNEDGTPEVINDGVLVSPFKPKTWHKQVYGGSRK